MKFSLFTGFFLAVEIFSVLFAVGCNNADDSPIADITGRWMLKNISDESAMAMNVIQTDRDVIGNIMGDGISHLTGKITGNTLSATIQWSNGDVCKIMGSISPDGITMQGTSRNQSGISTQWAATKN